MKKKKFNPVKYTKGKMREQIPIEFWIRETKVVPDKRNKKRAKEARKEIENG